MSGTTIRQCIDELKFKSARDERPFLGRWKRSLQHTGGAAVMYESLVAIFLAESFSKSKVNVKRFD